MIKNIVFDMGNVLLTFDPEKCIENFVENQEDMLLIKRELFGKSEWKGLDRGTITEEEAVHSVCKRVPVRLHTCVSEVMLHWHEYSPCLDDIYDLIKELKEKEYKIYLLSNASKRFYEYKDKIPALKFFDGLFISADYLMVKPEIQIYKKLCEVFKLCAEECYFVDDLIANVEAAVAYGMSAYCYDGDINRLREKLKVEEIL